MYSPCFFSLWSFPSALFSGYSVFKILYFVKPTIENRKDCACKFSSFSNRVFHYLFRGSIMKLILACPGDNRTHLGSVVYYIWRGSNVLGFLLAVRSRRSTTPPNSSWRRMSVWRRRQSANTVILSSHFVCSGYMRFKNYIV